MDRKYAIETKYYESEFYWTLEYCTDWLIIAIYLWFYYRVLCGREVVRIIRIKRDDD